MRYSWASGLLPKILGPLLLMIATTIAIVGFSAFQLWQEQKISKTTVDRDATGLLDVLIIQEGLYSAADK